MKTLTFLLLSLSILVLTSACSSDVSEPAYYENGMSQDPYAQGQQSNDPYANSQQVNNSYSNQQQMNYQNSSTPEGFVRMTDPKENAFSVLMPKGWQAQVSLERPGGQIRSCGVATSPDGATRIFLGDPNIPTFFSPNLGYADLIERQPMSKVRQQVSAAQFAQEYIQQVFGQQGRPQMGQPARDQELLFDTQQKAREAGVQVQIDLAVVPFTTSWQGKAIQGELVCSIMAQPEFWIASVSGFTTTDRDVAKISSILRVILKSQKSNPEWLQKEKMKQQQQQMQSQQMMAQSQAAHQQRMANNQAQFNAHQQRMQANQQAFDAHNQSWNQQQQINDQSHQNYMNYLRDENTITNGGYQSQVQSGYNYYWVDPNTNEYIGTQFNENPDPTRYQLWQKK